MNTTYSNNNNYRRNNYRRREINAVNYTKRFETFEEGYSEMITLVPEIKGYGGEEAIYESVINKILETVADNIPTIKSSYYPNSLSFSIDSHEVGLKTDAGAAFGWRVAFDRESGKTYYNFRVTFISLPAYRKKNVDDLETNDWEKTETDRQSRFWNNVEGKRRYNNNNPHRRFNNTEEQTTEEKTEPEVKEEAPVAEPVVEDTPKEINDDMKAAFEAAGYEHPQEETAAEENNSTEQ